MQQHTKSPVLFRSSIGVTPQGCHKENWWLSHVPQVDVGSVIGVLDNGIRCALNFSNSALRKSIWDMEIKYLSW